MQSLKQLCTPRESVFDVQRRDTVLDLSDLIEDKRENMAMTNQWPLFDGN